MGELLIRYGHGHRARERGRKAFESAGLSFRCVVIGMGVYGAVVPDTPQAREITKQLGWTVPRKQWDHLKRE